MWSSNRSGERIPDPGSGGRTGREETVSSELGSVEVVLAVEMVGSGSVEKEDDW